ncbi:MAG: aminotransferase class III-fold pyridoxal phosphate-dependent enzyme [Bacteroidetes bacterium]|nr:MAG: aminotransferase class III-fold pyridoxal phosphate-dependent enzyme [Bacteroidota bacterium]
MLGESLHPPLTDTLRQAYGLEGNLHPLVGYDDANFRLTTSGGETYLVKVASAGTPPALLDLQASLMTHLAGRNLPIDLPRLISSQDGATRIALRQTPDRWLRVLHWIEGTTWGRVRPTGPDLLRALGQAAGALDAALADFAHPAAHRSAFEWDLAHCLWIEDQLDALANEEQRTLVRAMLARYRQDVLPHLSALPTQVIHNDLNDLNILLQPADAGWAVHGFIDWGDACHSQRIHELAIAGAYACMGLPDPLGGLADLTEGYHAACPLTETEVEVLFPLVAMRLCVSVVSAARNRRAQPDHAYLSVSEAPAWTLLEKLNAIHPRLAHAQLRQACGWEACPAQPAFIRWATTQPVDSFRPVLDLPADTRATRLDLSVGSLDLGGNDAFATPARLGEAIARRLQEVRAGLGVGGYGEARPFYTTDAYQETGNEGPRWRSIHLGLDLWAPAGTLVCAPLAGRVHSLQDNDVFLDYGPTVILAHEPEDGPSFFTLYGHLSRASLAKLRVGQAIAAGAPFARLGEMAENGHWPPHLHVQILLDPLDQQGQYPGLAFPENVPVWQSLCPDPALLLGDFGLAPTPTLPEVADILAGRSAYLGPNLSLSYSPPLHIRRGYGAYLYAHTGRRYLDTVNNVAHVGHEHPAVVRAGQRQMAILNTNTRYLHPEIVAFAEELQATLPAPLSVCYFVNSGSEANELALRMVRTATGREDMLALEIGYHGNTGACIGVSSYKFDGKGGQGAPPSTHIVPMPDPYRGRYRGADTGPRYAAHVTGTLNRLQEAGRAPAGLIAESILSCGGQIVPPDGFLREAYARVRAAGGLVIADEVQTGLGRVGEAFWAFALQGVIPDIVTIGKPLGNGHPVAAVVTTRAIADAFANGMEYFNTFGGNPVSCAIGRAVLRTVQEQGLARQAGETGAYLTEGLQDLQARYPAIGEVRGAGLFLGIELVADPEDRTPDLRLAAQIVQQMYRRGILMSTDGPQHNVLKIKPPMCFGRLEADILLDQLSQVLAYLRPA